jgi:hypothetical protein
VNTTNRKLRTGAAGLIAVVAIGIAAPAASAQQINAGGGPTNDQYDPPVVQVETQAGANDPSDPSGLTDPVGPLPFTGFDVIAMLAVALAVTGLGLALQRAVANRPSD